MPVKPIRIMIKRPRQGFSRPQYIKNFDVLRTIVADTLEFIYVIIKGTEYVIVCDEAGIPKNLEPNFEIGEQTIYGTVAFLKSKKSTREEFDNLTDDDVVAIREWFVSNQKNVNKDFIKWLDDFLMEVGINIDENHPLLNNENLSPLYEYEHALRFAEVREALYHIKYKAKQQEQQQISKTLVLYKELYSDETERKKEILNYFETVGNKLNKKAGGFTVLPF